jgi:pyrimidine deaminase RibD-like protein/tetratricopeptide (TPR) repeat protein
MKLAIRKAKESKSMPGKTPIYVGAVVTKNGKMLEACSRGQFEIGVHAEVTALGKLQNIDLEGATLYTTLEPCITGSHQIEKYRWPCARWIVERKIMKVWIGDLDPNENICGRGVAYLENNGIIVDFFPANLRSELKNLNTKFIEKQKRPTILLADRNNEKRLIWKFLENLQFQTERSSTSRLLWFYGPPGIGKSELLAWLRVVAGERGIIKTAKQIVLSDNPTIIYFRQLAKVEDREIEMVQKAGGSTEDYICTAVAYDLSANGQPRIFILDSDCRFNDVKGLSILVERLLSKLEIAPHLGIVVATRNLPEDIPAHNLQALSFKDVEEMVNLNNWKISKKIIEEIYSKSNGNPLLAILFHACYVKSGRIPGSTDLREILQVFLSHLNPMARGLLIKIAIFIAAPFEQEEKGVDKNILLATISTEERALAEKALKELNDMNILNTHSNLWMHDEIIEQIEKLIPENELIQQHYEIAQILKDKDPLGAVWHLMKSGKVDEGVKLLEAATKFSFEHLQITRFIQIFNAVANWLEKNIILERRVLIKSHYLVNLGIVCSTLAEVEDKAENCEKAIKAYEEALKVYTFNRFPSDYAMTQGNLGNVYGILAEEEAKTENCKKAISAYEEALKVYTFDRFPSDYATAQNNLGNVYGILAEEEAKAENCEKAIKAYEEALKVYTFNRFPSDYAMTQNNFGNVYRILAEEEAKAENCEKAIKAFDEALKVYTFDRFPADYAMTQGNLGIAYGILARKEAKAENCEKAINAFEEALKVYTLAHFPMQYAKTQNNLGNAYGILARKEAKTENCKKAISAYEEALKVYTEKEFTGNCQMVKGNLKKLLDFYARE